MTERIPAEAFHPAGFILAEMKARGWARDDIVARVEADTPGAGFGFRDYLDKKPGIMVGAKGFACLGRIFNLPPEDFMNLHRAWIERDQE